jgi:hypothetical protein
MPSLAIVADADQKLLPADTPLDPSNRRIFVIVHSVKKPAEATSTSGLPSIRKKRNPRKAAKKTNIKLAVTALGS